MADSRTQCRSAIWHHFKINSGDSNKAKCNHCGVLISRGSKAVNYSTKPLINHIEAKHVQEYKDFKSSSLQQELKGSELRNIRIVSTLLIFFYQFYSKLFF